MSSEQPIYRIQFINNGKNYQLFVCELSQSPLFGFIEIGDFVFNSHGSLVVDPSEEKLKTEFSGVSRSYIPLQAVIRIDVVTEKGSARISDLGENVTMFPYFAREEAVILGQDTVKPSLPRPRGDSVSA